MLDAGLWIEAEELLQLQLEVVRNLPAECLARRCWLRAIHDLTTCYRLTRKFHAAERLLMENVE
jgi:hypothetical protein